MADNYDKNWGGEGDIFIRTKETSTGVHAHHVVVDDGTGVALPVVSGPVTSQKGLRVYGGPTDPVSDVPVQIDFDHHQLHEGETYRAIVPEFSLATGTSYFQISVTTYANPIQSPHMIVGAHIYNGNARIDFYRESTATTGGTALTAHNRNRNSTNSAGSTIKTVSTLAGGTLIESFYVGSGSRAAGDNRVSSEWILKSNQTYRVDVVGLEANTKAVVFFDWYEDLGV